MSIFYNWKVIGFLVMSAGLTAFLFKISVILGVSIILMILFVVLIEIIDRISTPPCMRK